MAVTASFHHPRPGRAVALRPARPPVRRPVRRRPVAVHRVRVGRYRSRIAARGQDGVPGWVWAAAAALLLLGGGGATQVPGLTGSAEPTSAEAEVACTGVGPGGQVDGFSGSQLAHAAAIVAAGKEMGVPERGQVVAVATAIQESRLKMYANSGDAASLRLPHDAVGADHDSVGLFQQRARGWGSLEERMDPKASARRFYNGLLAVPGWESMPLTQAAQAVQRSAHPTRYADDEPAAAHIVTAVSSGITCTPRT